MAYAIGFSLTFPLFRQIAAESKGYDWLFYEHENMGMGMRQDRFLGDEYNQFGGHQENHQVSTLKPVDSKDNLQVAGEHTRKPYNIKRLESRF